MKRPLVLIGFMFWSLSQGDILWHPNGGGHSFVDQPTCETARGALAAAALGATATASTSTESILGSALSVQSRQTTANSTTTPPPLVVAPACSSVQGDIHP